MVKIILAQKDIDRFVLKLRRDEITGCLLWTGSKDSKGYGHFRIGRRIHKTHRVAWVIAGRPITSERPWVLHDCPFGDNPPCCNPDHLWAGTAADNSVDRERKSRGRKSRKGLLFGVNPKKNGRFQSAIFFERKLLCLGTYDTQEQASAVALAKRKQLRGW